MKKVIFSFMMLVLATSGAWATTWTVDPGGGGDYTTIPSAMIERVEILKVLWRGARVLIDAAMVEDRLSEVVADMDLSRFIL